MTEPVAPGEERPTPTTSANSLWAIENEKALSAAYAVAFDKWRIVGQGYEASFRAMVRTAIRTYLDAARPALPAPEPTKKCATCGVTHQVSAPHECAAFFQAFPAPEPKRQRCRNCGFVYLGEG